MATSWARGWVRVARSESGAPSAPPSPSSSPPPPSSGESRTPSKSAEEAREDFRRAFLESRAQAIGRTVRCLVCANQSVEDSDSEVAVGLRRVIRQQLALNKTDEQVRDFLVDQYGEYVLYSPPLDAQTVLLWSAPVLVVAAVGAYLAYSARRSRWDAVSVVGARPRRLPFRTIDGLLDDVPLQGAEVKAYRDLLQLPGPHQPRPTSPPPSSS